MRVLVEGSGGVAGWPQPGCRCASCLRAELDGSIRARSTIIIDGVVRLGVGGAENIGGGDTGSGAGNEGAGNGGAGSGAGNEGAGNGGVGAGNGGAGAGTASRGAGAYRIQELADARNQGKPGGWEVTGPDGARLLYPARPGAVPEPAEGAAAYDIAFLDLAGGTGTARAAPGPGADHRGHGHGGGVRGPPGVRRGRAAAALRVLAGGADRGRGRGDHGPFNRKRVHDGAEAVAGPGARRGAVGQV